MTVENISIDVKTNAGSAASQFQSLSNALNSLRTTASGVQSANSGASSSMNSVASAANRAASSSKSAARAIDDVSKSAKKVQSPLGNFVASLKRIAFYRFLRTILKEISAAIREGLENVYEWSKAGGDMGEIASALDRISSAGQQLKNQLGAAFAELLVALEPIIVALINLLTMLAQALTWVIALLSGKGYYPVAKQIAKDWKEADKAAGGYKNTILGFDEINRLNDDGGGGSGGNGLGGFDWEPIGFDFNFKWPPMPDWLPRLERLLRDFQKLPDTFPVPEPVPTPEPLPAPEPFPVPEPVPDFGPVKVTIEVPDPLPEPLQVLQSLLEFSPYLIGVEIAVLGGALAALAAIASLISKISSFPPIEVLIRAIISNPIPQLQSITQDAIETIGKLSLAFESAFSKIGELFANLNNSYAENVNNIAVENSTLGQDVIDTYNRLKNPLDGWISHFWEKVGEYQQASGALQLENATLAEDMKMTFENIKESVRTGLEGAKTNVNTFVTQTLPSWISWCNNVAENAMLAMENVATNIWASLQNAADNIVSFVNSTAQGFVSWAQSTAQSVFAWASNVLTNIGNALKGAWESIKSFAQATGEAIGGFFKENAQIIIPAAIGAAIVIGAIALAPPTGGASLAAIALAAGGGEFPNDGTLFVAGEAGPEIVANMGSRTGVMNVDQMEAAVANGNMGVINAVYGMANMIVAAVNAIDPDITLDGESLADKMYNYNKNAATRRGMAMVT